jgi:hypothetical protein
MKCFVDFSDLTTSSPYLESLFQRLITIPFFRLAIMKPNDSQPQNMLPGDLAAAPSAQAPPGNSDQRQSDSGC